MEPIELSYALKPILLEDEVLMLIAEKTTLSDSSINRKPVTTYLTSHRLIFIDEKLPEAFSAELLLSKVHKHTSEVNFLRTGSKIIVQVVASIDDCTAQASQLLLKDSSEIKAYSPADSTIPNTHSTISPFNPIEAWECSICKNINLGNAANKCQLCGVAKFDSPSPPPNRDSSKKTCPVCTFLNHSALEYCEMCESSLSPKLVHENNSLNNKKSTNANSSRDLKAFSQTASLLPELIIRFEKNSAISFAQTLKRLLKDQAWLKIPTITPADQINHVKTKNMSGISGILIKNHKSEQARQLLLDQAFEDLDELSIKAKEIVSLAKDIVSKLNSNSTNTSTGSPEINSNSDSDFNKYLNTIGIDNPVTKDIAGSSYHKVLARELFEFLEDYIFKNNGLVLVTEAYCLYNRARSFSSVFPADFIEACKLFEELGLPLKLRKFPSGILALQSDSSIGIFSSDNDRTNNKVDDIFEERVKELVESFGSLSAIQYSAIDGLPLLLANELLLGYEHQQVLCRDETLQEIRFYKNIFN
ncbi:hypothetical protein BB561_004315 [Smittium simulii]|uniref:Vacuolar protein-sorting-associated protein 36 n=1 Tax=Smittium simulii TaxID=133385 RepID=A0A2T9YGY9_9FUNG|nr:hypothetical protein BB561_004315 [Smittium simulii]